ncbi:MAG TPA: hypothetical protein HA252_00455 [Candidatus Diapherotrites archaeon]|uniref:Uncharacterized protein n=1 Tax=Candidatus Iainarchaeum sp. TaxID=3101447 RepID=A0A7J4JH29_9ARCH|nr:hypothetical protein [Candidatus Diapherotrites archaeon]HIH15859.1 hypothetical protein [Candidatus Diapherotrites archaeon]
MVSNRRRVGRTTRRGSVAPSSIGPHRFTARTLRRPVGGNEALKNKTYRKLSGVSKAAADRFLTATRTIDRSFALVNPLYPGINRAWCRAIAYSTVANLLVSLVRSPKDLTLMTPLVFEMPNGRHVGVRLTVSGRLPAPEFDVQIGEVGPDQPGGVHA